MSKLDHVKWKKSNPLRLYLNLKGGEEAYVSTLAEALEVSRAIIYLWMNGINNPQMRSFKKITDHTGITAEQWFEWLGRRPVARKGKGSAKRPEFEKSRRP